MDRPLDPYLLEQINREAVRNNSPRVSYTCHCSKCVKETNVKAGWTTLARYGHVVYGKAGNFVIMHPNRVPR